jgi:hypothetical protein
LYNDLELSALAQSESDNVVSELDDRHQVLLKKTMELEDVKKELSTKSGQLIVVARGYEGIQTNYRHIGSHLYQSFHELESNPSAHNGTQEESAASAAELIVARGHDVETEMDIEQARNRLFNTTADLIEANDDIHILQGLYQCHDFQKVLVNEREEDRTLLQKLHSWKSGERKWRKLPCRFFCIQILGHHFIQLSVTHIRDKKYTAKSNACVMDMHRGITCVGLMNFIYVNTSGKAGAQIPQLPLGDDSPPWGR